MSAQTQPMAMPYPPPTVSQETKIHPPGFVGIMLSNPLVATCREGYNAFHARREALGLSNPGTMQGIAFECRNDIFLNSQKSAVPGLQAEMMKGVGGPSPIFQVTHTLSANPERPSAAQYKFDAQLHSKKTSCVASQDRDSAMAVLRQVWSKRFTSMVNASFPNANSSQQGMAMGTARVVLTSEYSGDDFSADFTAESPSVGESGIVGAFNAQYLQSITPNLSLGVDAQYLRQDIMPGTSMAIARGALSYAARYKSNDWIASAYMSPFSMLKASYYRKLSDKVEAGVGLDVSASEDMGPTMAPKPAATASFGAKYSFNQNTFRAMVDTDGKVAALLETGILATMLLQLKLTFYGELDHAHNTSKTGMGLILESSTEEMAMAQQEMMMQGQLPPQ